jgi:hypothetical protein
MTISIPDDVREYINNVFKDCNDRVSNKLTTNPNSWETSLDMTLIDALTNYSASVKLPSNWLIRIDTHYLGGMRHWNNWEIADIGILIFFRKDNSINYFGLELLASMNLQSIKHLK